MSFREKFPLLWRLSWLLPSLAVLLVYGQVRGHQYTDIDDAYYTYDNVHIVKGVTVEGIKWAFTTSFVANYHPLTWISHMVDFQLFGDSPGKAALANAFFHALNATLVAALIFRIFDSLPAALFAGMVFGVHPQLVEAVAWICQRKSQLCTLFALITIFLYLQRLHEPSRDKRLRLQAFALLSFLLSLLAKGMFVTMPLLLVLLDLIYRETHPELKRPIESTPPPARGFGQLRSELQYYVLDVMPYAVLSVLFSGLTFWAQNRDGAVQAINSLSIADRCANLFPAYARYLRHFFFPSDLSFFYPLNRAWSVSILLLGLLPLCITTLLYGTRRRIGLIPILGWLFFLTALLPVIGLIQVGEQSSADRYMYQPVIGLLITLVPLFQLVFKSFRDVRKILAGGLGIWLCAAAWSGYRQVSYWQDSYSLSLASDRSIGPTEVSLALRSKILLTASRFEEAIDVCIQALKIDSTNPVALQNFSVAASCIGKTDLAIELCKRYIAVYPKSCGPSYINLALFYKQAGRLEESREALAKAKSYQLTEISELKLIQELTTYLAPKPIATPKDAT